MSQSASNTDSGAASPEAQFHLPVGRSHSPSNIDYNTNHIHNDILHRSSQMPQHADVNHQHPTSESVFAQGGAHPMYNSNNNFHLSDYLSESDSLSPKVPPQGTKSPGDFGAGPFRSSFSAYSGINGSHTPHSSSGNPPPGSFRMRQVNTSSTTSQSFASASESFSTHPLGIQHQLSQQSQQGSSVSSGFESRGIDFGNSPPLAGKVSQQFALDPFLQSHTAKTQMHDSFHPLSHSNSAGQVPYLNGIHLQSQTPYGPHLQTSGAVGGAVAGTARGLGTSGQLNAAVEPQSGGGQQEEISTIFVVGFPDDMQEREFQNMFTFSSGFEAATLKIPNKEYTAYGSSGGTPSGLPLRGSSSYSSYFNSGPNDPYNIVTVNQGGIVVDNGRDGPTTSWPPLPVPLNDEPSHFQGPGGQPPRKQIIGFAKFRTRQEALEARDMLQGRRVDIEKGAVLKAEMAKKNLHTKRGVGIGSTSSNGGSISLGSNLNALAGLNGGVSGLSALGGLGVTPDTLAGLAAGLNLNSSMNVNALASLSGGDSLAARERELNALSAISYNNLGSGWREGRLGDSSEEERERDRDRDRERRREALVGLNLGMGIGGRGARERALADEEERERLRRKDFKAAQSEAVRMLSGNPAVYDAFHPTSALSRNLQTSILSPSGDGASSGPNPMLASGFSSIIAQTSNRDDSGPREAVGPWDQPSPRERDSAYSALTSFYGTRKASVIPRPSSPQDTSPPKPNIPFSASLNDEDGMLPPHRSGILRSTQAFASAVDEPVVSRPPAPPSSSTSSTGGLDDGGPVPLTVSTSGQATGNTSPQLPSPASHASSTASSSVGGNAASSSSSGVQNTVGSVGPRNALVDQNPPINTLYVGNLPTSPVGAGYPANYLEDSLRELFSRRPGYRKLCFRQKSNGPMCFVEFEDVHYATKALNELYGNALGGLVKNGGIRLSYSKNPLGVRTPTTAGTTSLQQQSSTHSTVASPFQADAFQFRQGFDGDSGVINMRRDNSTTTSPPPSAFGYARSPPPPRFVSPPPPSGSFNMVSPSPTNGPTLPRGSHAFGISLSGTGGGFSPFGLPLSSPPDQSSTLPSSHSMIPDHQSSDVPLAHGHTQHFPHRALSPSSSTVEAARAG